MLVGALHRPRRRLSHQACPVTYDEIVKSLRANYLDVFGSFHTTEDDELGSGTLLLLGPHEPGFWSAFKSTPEWLDNTPDPMDRWSQRVITEVAQIVDAKPLFPFGAPVRPFFTWALRSGRAWSSPVLLLVHDTAGLLVSYRGALFVPRHLNLPAKTAKPCDTCSDKPCLTACPVAALSGDGYDLPTCHAFLDTAPGADCMTNGCAARRACPVSQSYGRVSEQSAYHMGQFHK